MAVLKLGSKGKDVEEAQKLLNKVGNKLKVDGDFGKNTHNAVVAFQKKCKMGVDGKIGPNTLAALKYGKPLPKFPDGQYFGSAGGPETKIRDLNLKKAQMSKDVVRLIGVMQTEWAKFSAATIKREEAIQGTWARHIQLVQSLNSHKKQFDALVQSNPSKAAKLASEAEAMIKEYDNSTLPALTKHADQGRALDAANSARCNANLKAVQAAISARDKT